MDRIKLKVLGLSYSMSQTGAYALILADEQDVHRIPIVIGMSEAQSIAIQLEKMKTQRPLTHDLIKKLADALVAKLKEVYIYRLDAGIFYSELLFETEKKLFKIDSRTSDAIALALRYDCPIFSTPEIIEKAGILVRQERNRLHEDTLNLCLLKSDEEIIRRYSARDLTEMLDEAVQKEEYEKASKIRDLLKMKKK
ncbi:MAG: DUF151 domain-containing protein [Odoribacter sp.]